MSTQKSNKRFPMALILAQKKKKQNKINCNIYWSVLGENKQFMYKHIVDFSLKSFKALRIHIKA